MKSWRRRRRTMDNSALEKLRCLSAGEAKQVFGAGKQQLISLLFTKCTQWEKYTKENLVYSLLQRLYSYLTLWRWQNSIPLSTCHKTLRTMDSSRPCGYFSRSSRTVWSTNSNTRYSRFFRRNTSIRFTRFSWRSCCKHIKRTVT